MLNLPHSRSPKPSPTPAAGDERERAVATLQAGYFLLTGLWPLLHLRSFEAITGRKTDRWLVRTVGVLVTAIGAALGLAARRRRLTPEVRLLATTSALGLAGIDVVYVARRRIRPVYLLDAAAELVLVAAWRRALGR